MGRYECYMTPGFLGCNIRIWNKIRRTLSRFVDYKCSSDQRDNGTQNTAKEPATDLSGKYHLNKKSYIYLELSRTGKWVNPNNIRSLRFIHLTLLANLMYGLFTASFNCVIVAAFWQAGQLKFYLFYTFLQNLFLWQNSLPVHYILFYN